MKTTRRKFIQKSTLTTAGLYLGSMGFSAASYSRILGANDRVRVGVIGFSDRFRSSLLPCFHSLHKELNFDIMAVSDIWKLRREDGKAQLKEKFQHTIIAYRNNEELYASKDVDAVIISTADFQHALHAIEAVQAGCDAYVEKPFAETMEDNRVALKAIKESQKIVQIGSQRRSGLNYSAAADFIQAGKFGAITMVELTWNLNQPARWRRVEAVAKLKEADTDWKRFLLNRPLEPFDPRKYLEFRLFWPYSSGMPGQWMSHQIDTVHWFTGLKHPRSVVANGGIYKWKDGRKNWDTTTAVFDYGDTPGLPGGQGGIGGISPHSGAGFQVTFSSRMHNGDDDPTEVYYSNGGELNLQTNKVSPSGGLKKHHAQAMGMDENRLPELDLATAAKVETAANTGADYLTTAHMRNWMDCVRNRKQPNAPVEAGYAHAIACIMTNAAVRTGSKATFDETNQEVIAGGKIFYL